LFVDAALRIVRIGVPWRDLPEAFGNWNGILHRFSRWNQKGVMERSSRLSPMTLPSNI